MLVPVVIGLRYVQCVGICVGTWHSPVGGQRTDVVLGGLMMEICTETLSY